MPARALTAYDTTHRRAACDGHALHALTLPWFVGLSYWRQLTFREACEHEVVVSPGPDGRPGERLLAPSRALHRPKVVGGSRNGEPAFRYTVLLPRTRFTEWKFQRAGWLYAVGAFNRRRDSGTEARARDVLASWEWLDPS